MNTPNLNLSLTPATPETPIKFGQWRQTIDGESNSNMTKIDAAFGALSSKETVHVGSTAPQNGEEIWIDPTSDPPAENYIKTINNEAPSANGNISIPSNYLFDGFNLTTKFASEITAANGDPWAWIKSRIQSGNYVGLNIGDYIPFSVTIGSTVYTFSAQIAGINTYIGMGETGSIVGNHIDFISRELWPVSQSINLGQYNNGLALPWGVVHDSSITWENRSINSSNGGMNTATNLTRVTSRYLSFGTDGGSVSVPSGYKVYWYQYGSQSVENYITNSGGFLNGPIFVRLDSSTAEQTPRLAYYRFVVAKTDDSNIDMGDAQNPFNPNSVVIVREFETSPWLSSKVYHWLNSKSGTVPWCDTTQSPLPSVPYGGGNGSPVYYGSSTTSEPGVLRRLPEQLKNVIIEKTFPVETRLNTSTRTGATDQTILTQSPGYKWANIGKIWLPTEFEVTGTFGSGTKRFSTMGSVQYPIFAHGNRIKELANSTYNDKRASWWTMTPSGETAGTWAYNNKTGFAQNYYTQNFYYTPICFRVG